MKNSGRAKNMAKMNLKIKYKVKKLLMKRNVNSLRSISEALQYWFIWKFLDDDVIEEYARDTPRIMEGMEQYFADSDDRYDDRYY